MSEGISCHCLQPSNLIFRCVSLGGISDYSDPILSLWWAVNSDILRTQISLSFIDIQIIQPIWSGADEMLLAATVLLLGMVKWKRNFKIWNSQVEDYFQLCLNLNHFIRFSNILREKWRCGKLRSKFAFYIYWTSNCVQQRISSLIGQVKTVFNNESLQIELQCQWGESQDGECGHQVSLLDKEGIQSVTIKL